MTRGRAHCLRGCMPHPVLEPDDEWITTSEAARLLNSSKSAFTSYRLRNTLRNRHAPVGAGNPRLWYRPDVELAAEIRREAKTGVGVAARLAKALIDGRIQHDSLR